MTKQILLAKRDLRTFQRLVHFFRRKSVFCPSILVYLCRCGGIGRHEGLKIPFLRRSAGSIPAAGTIFSLNNWVNVLHNLIRFYSIKVASYLYKKSLRYGYY